MSVTKILFTSVLKPVDDIRMYQKIGFSLAKIDNAEIHIAGFKSNNPPDIENVVFHPLFSFSRLSIKRIFSGFKIWQLQLKVKPELIICNTHELLIVTLLNKILFGSRIVYDVQENYFNNLWYGDQFPFLLKHVLAILVRIKERLLYPFFDSSMVAEKCYIKQMPFLGSKSIIIENKYKISSGSIASPPPEKYPLKLLYTGTIARIYGTLDAIHLAKQLLLNKEGTFTIVGFCPDLKFLSEVRDMIEDDSRIELIAGESPVQHQKILSYIKSSNLGIISYEQNRAIKDRIPTRVYEYIANRLPFIYPQEAIWKQLVTDNQAGIPVNFNSVDPVSILNAYESCQFFVNPVTQDIFFDQEVKKVYTMAIQLLKM